MQKPNNPLDIGFNPKLPIVHSINSYLLEKEGWKVDIKESTRRAIKYRRDSKIVISPFWFAAEVSGINACLLRFIQASDISGASRLLADKPARLSAERLRRIDCR